MDKRDVLDFLIAVAVVVFAAVAVGRAFRALGLPQVIGEVLAGLLLGPSLLGLVALGSGSLSTVLIPESVRAPLGGLAQVGLVIYMFTIGLEVDPNAVRLERTASTRISLFSITTAFAVGFGAGWVAFPASQGRAAVALFCGLGLCGSAFAILARVLEDRRLFRTRIGPVLLGSAVVDDVMVWVVTPMVLLVAPLLGAQVKRSAEDGNELLSFVGFVVFAAVLFIVLRPLVGRAPGVIDRLRTPSPSILAVLTAVLLLSAATTQWLLGSAILGAFMLGAALPRSVAPGLATWFDRSVLPLVSVVLLPIFFAVIGLEVDVPGLIEQRGAAAVGLLVLFLVVALVGKVAGAFLGAWSSGFPGRRSLAIGVLMSTRGLTELAILKIGLESNIIDREQFTILVCAAIGSTLLCAPLLALVYPQRLVDRDIELMERDLAASAGTYRVLVVLDDLDRSDGLLRLVTAVTVSARNSEVVAAYLGPAATGSERLFAVGDLSDRLERLRRISGGLERSGLRVSVQALVSRHPAGELLELVERIQPTVVVLDGRRVGEREEQSLAASLIDLAISDVIVVNDVSGLDLPPLIVGSSADPDSRSAAAEIALRIAAARGASLHLGSGRDADLFGRVARRLGVELGDRHASGVIVDAALGPGSPISAWGRPGAHRARIADGLATALSVRNPVSEH